MLGGLRLYISFKQYVRILTMTMKFERKNNFNVKNVNMKSQKKNLRKHIRKYHEDVAISEAKFELGNI